MRATNPQSNRLGRKEPLFVLESHGKNGGSLVFEAPLFPARYRRYWGGRFGWAMTGQLTMGPVGRSPAM